MTTCTLTTWWRLPPEEVGKATEAHSHGGRKNGTPAAQDEARNRGGSQQGTPAVGNVSNWRRERSTLRREATVSLFT